MANPTAPMLDLLACVFALVTQEGDAGPRYAGTAFFIGYDGRFLTAGHVLRGAEAPVFAVLLDHDKSQGGPRAAAVEDVVISDEVDLATGRVVGVEQVLGIRPMGRYPLAGEDLLVVEYSRSTAVDERTGNLGFADPEVWKGYVVRSYKSDMPPHPRPTYCYELSVPAISGASGAPVISVDDHTLAGVIVANVGRELMPATVERLERANGPTEEVRFYLPHAEAIAWTELIKALPEGVPHPWGRQDVKTET